MTSMYILCVLCYAVWQISLPLLILHGKADIVTDPSVSKTLYEKARSSDKKLNLYDDGCHALLEGELDDVILRVFNDIITWLDEHTARKWLFIKLCSNLKNVAKKKNKGIVYFFFFFTFVTIEVLELLICSLDTLFYGFIVI